MVTKTTVVMLQFVTTTYTKDWSFNTRDVQRMRNVWMEVCELELRANHRIKHLSLSIYDNIGLYHWCVWTTQSNGKASDMLYDLAMHCIHRNFNIVVSCTYIEVTQE